MASNYEHIEIVNCHFCFIFVSQKKKEKNHSLYILLRETVLLHSHLPAREKKN
jgi:hypothetical protein